MARYRLLVACLLLSIAPLVSTSTAAAEGFFTGRRGEMIGLLRQANAANTSTDDAMKLIQRAKALNEDGSDRYVDLAIDSTLSRLYQAAGDTKAAAVHEATSNETTMALLRADGFAQSAYTIWLMGFDLEIHFSSNEEVDLFGQLHSLIDEIDPDVVEDPQEQRDGERLKAALTELRDAGLRRDVPMLKRARRNVLALLDEVARRTAPDATAHEKKMTGVARDSMSAMLDLVVADVSRDRPGFERAARKMALFITQLMESGEIDEQ